MFVNNELGEGETNNSSHCPAGDPEPTVHRLAPPYPTMTLDFLPLPDAASRLPIPFFQIPFAVSRLY